MYFLTQYLIPIVARLFWPLFILLAGAAIGLALLVRG
jgi:hypothetical protein